jgi:SAM-dependent methyltransferase
MPGVALRVLAAAEREEGEALPLQTDYPLDRRVGPEARKTYREKIESGFLAKYLSGPSILDIGHKGADPDAETIVPHAIGVGFDYPGYDGLRLPFPDGSQDAVYSSHCLEHIPDSKGALAEWYRVLRVGGHIVLAVPHQWLYERKATLPSRFNRAHRRFYTPASLLAEVEQALPPGGYRVRLLRDNDDGFNYNIPPQQHAGGSYEIELVLEKLDLPTYQAALTVSPLAIAITDTYAAVIRHLLESGESFRPADAAQLHKLGAALPIPPYAVLRQRFPDVPEVEFRRLLRPMVDPGVVDPDWYLRRYRELPQKDDSGDGTDARAHYRGDGYFEHRQPRPIDPIYG